MFVSHTPINLPVSTANLAVESLVKEATQKPQIPETSPSTQPSNAKHSTDFSEQNKPDLLNSLLQDQTIKEQKEGSENLNQDQDNQDKNEQDNSKQESKSQESGSNENTTTSALEPELNLAEQKQIAELQARDREVRAHEAAHASVGGSIAGSPNLNFTKGADGKRYATSGDVSIDISKVANDPAATIDKLEQVQRAALAPAQPSSQDRKVAAIASAGINEAKAEIRLESFENSKATNIDSKDESINPVRAKRESQELEQKLANSGAITLEQEIHQLSFTA